MGTSIGISEALKNRLYAFKKTYALTTYEDTLTTMLNYFDQVGDDPTNPQFTAKAQIVGMNKRLDQIVRFIQTFEKQKLQPVLSEITKQSRHMMSVLPSGTSMATKADIAELVELLQDLSTHEEMKDAVLSLYDVLNPQKTKQGQK